VGPYTIFVMFCLWLTVYLGCCGSTMCEDVD